MEEVLSPLAWFWGMFLDIPWWFHVFITGPLGLFLAVRVMVPLILSLVGDLTERKARIVPRKEEEELEKKPKEANLGIEGLVSTAVGMVVAANLLSQLVEEVEAVPNQLIQKRGREPVGRTQAEYKQLVHIASTERSLKEGFEKINSEEGLKRLTRLEAEYKGLTRLLKRSSIEDTVLNLQRVSKLVESLYQQGLSFLLKALSIAEQLSTSSKEDLLAESEELKEELGKFEPDSTLHKMVSERIANNEKSLATVKGQSEKLDEYFCQVGLLRDSIREIRLGVPELLDNKPKEEHIKIQVELKTRVEMAQRVQAEYDRQGI